jgi:hypothetical protein
MKRYNAIRPIVALVLVLSSFKIAMADNSEHCKNLANNLLNSKPAELDIIIGNFVTITNSEGCFQQAVRNSVIQKAIQDVTPAPVPLLNAIESLSGSQQQGSSLSSSGSTNAVTKPSGPTSLIEEFGGASTTTGTSSMTFQWSPGTMLRNFVLSGYEDLCDLVGQASPKSQCIKKSLINGLIPLTFKVTSNTSTGSNTISGTAASSSSGSTSQPVTVSSKGNSGPSFTGLTVQYSFYGSKSQAATNAATNAVTTSSIDPQISAGVDKLITQVQGTLINLDNCDVYKAWNSSAAKNLTDKISSIRTSTPGLTADQQKQQTVQLQAYVEDQYVTLIGKMLDSVSCSSALNSMPDMYAAVINAETAEALTSQTSSAKPELAIEYDLNTPTNQPDYSAVKLTGNWQFGPKSAAASKAAATAYAKNAGIILASASAKSGNTTDTNKQLKATAKSSAQTSTPPWSLTFNGVADIYNRAPPSSVPSATRLRDIQAGAEIAYLFAPTVNASPLRKFMGNMTLAGAYSYQDQTSPAMLTGPALSDFTGLPSSTTTAYAPRGVIHLGQIRFGFGTGSSTNFTYPVAFTYSNRTELIVHPTWRAQVGITYNFNSLFSSSSTTPTPATTTSAASPAK